MAAPINDLDNAELIRQREADILWASEKEIRLRCDGLTPLETLGLRKNFLWQSDTRCFYNDAEKVQSFFGQCRGGTAACKRLLKRCMEKAPSVPGQQVNVKEVQFTLGKHLLLADRRQRMRDECPPNILPCRCFAATYVMPAGCVHCKVQLWKLSVLQESLCPTCSVCLRCNKLPG